METNEIEKLAKLKRLTAQYFTTLKPTKDKNTYTVQFKIVNYLELGCVITDMLKLCILALDHDMHKIDQKKHESINVSLILETVVQMFPLDEFEFLSYVGEMVGE
ncbi:hypothetical protein C8C83_0169 [Flavobacterium sp. 90]|uniref:hypothetical protein n=1 Tax=Flavobacterium sp. 90 TaxID=2135622 RepID=UPI00104B2E2D|nr:hypothetical protein [Flavobacterium sp. 90]TCK52376.1 hypothetical protein C8C83_0169 [Flavobacterium sp. 90]